MSEFQLPKDCYGLYNNLEEKMEKNAIEFDEALKKLSQPGYWVEIDWLASSRAHKKDIKATPMLLISATKKTIERNFGMKNISEISSLVRKGYGIFLSARIIHNWKYKTKKIISS